VLSCAAALTVRDGGLATAEPTWSRDDDVIVLPAAPLTPEDIGEPGAYTGEVEGVRRR